MAIPAFFFHLLIIFRSGSYYCYQNNCGYFFWGVHGNDAVWNLAIVNTAFSQLPFVHPVFYGALMSGYNYFIDFLLFLLSKVGINAIVTYFKIFPIAWFILITYLAINLSFKINKKPLFTFFLLFFIFFGGSFSYLFTLYHHKTLIGSSGTLAMQAGLTLTNLHFASSLVVVLWILNIVKDGNRSLRNSLLLSLLVFLNLAFKFYGGVISIFIVTTYFFIFFIQRKDVKKFVFDVSLLGLFCLAAIILFYDPFASLKSGSILKFSPLALVWPIIEEPDLFYLPKLANARYVLQAQGFGPRLVLIELFTLFVFLLFNFGTRFFGFIYLIVKAIKKEVSTLDITVLAGVAGSILMSVLFIQKGEWWNTIQFIYYGLFLSSIFIAYFLNYLFSKKQVIPILIGTILMILTIPSNIDLIIHFTSFPAPSYLPKEEIAALNYLKSLPQGTVFTMPYDKTNRQKYDKPVPLFAYDDTAYVPAFSHKQVYLAEAHVLRTTGVVYEDRLKEITDLKNLKLENLPIEYIYLQKDHELFNQYQSKVSKNFWKKILDNKKVIIYERKHKD